MLFFIFSNSEGGGNPLVNLNTSHVILYPVIPVVPLGYNHLNTSHVILYLIIQFREKLQLRI